MTLEELLELLDLDEASQFEFFENISELVESDREIDTDVLYQLFRDVNMDVLADLYKTYFDEILDSIPDQHMDLYSLLDSIKMMLVGMAGHMENENDLLRMADEFARFRRWYSIESEVWIVESGSKEPHTCMTVRDALTQSRLEKLDGSIEYIYNFDDVLNYEIDDYSMTFADLINEEESDYDPELAEYEDMDIPGLEYTDSVFKPDKFN